MIPDKSIPIKKTFGIKNINLDSLLIIILIGLMTGLVLLQSNPLTSTLGRDGASFAYIGDLILKGKIPYIDVWDSKPPGIFYLNAFALLIGQGTRWGIWLVEFIFLFLGSLTAYKFMKQQWNYAAAIFGIMAFFFGLNTLLMVGNLTEEYPLLFSFLALFAFWKSLHDPQKKRYDIIIGITFALSFLFRANNIGMQLSIFVTTLIISIVNKDMKLLIRRMALWGISALLVLVIVCVYFATKNALFSMIEASIFYNFSYIGSKQSIWVGIVKLFEGLPYISWFALIGYVFLISRFIESIKKQQLDPIALLFLINWPVEIYTSTLSGRYYTHYFISCLPVLAMLNSNFFFSLSPKILAAKLIDWVEANSIYVVSGLLLFIIYFSWNGLATYMYSFNRIIFNRAAGIQNTTPVARYIRNNTNPEDTVFVWGSDININFESQRDSPTSYIWYPAYVASSPYTTALANGFLSDIIAHPPKFFVDAYSYDPDHNFSLDPATRADQISMGAHRKYAPPNLNDFFAYFDNNYLKISEIDGFDIYELQK